MPPKKKAKPLPRQQQLSVLFLSESPNTEAAQDAPNSEAVLDSPNAKATQVSTDKPIEVEIKPNKVKKCF